MPFISLVLALVIAGIASWLINRFIPTASHTKTILNSVDAAAVRAWVMRAVGLRTGFTSFRLQR